MRHTSETIELQFINYCKGWYQETDLIKDIAVFQGEWSGCDPEHLKGSDVMWFVNMVWTKYTERPMDVHELMMNAFKRKSMWEPVKDLKLGFEDFIAVMMSEIRYFHKGNKIKEWIRPDPSFLPLNLEHTLEKWDGLTEQKGNG